MWGCFNPKLAPSECTADNNQCPGNLECSPQGFCCEPGEECAPTDIDAAPPDAAVTTFSDFGPYTCDSDSLVLVHFDGSGGFQNDPLCGGQGGGQATVDEEDTPTRTPNDMTGFLQAATLAPSGDTKYVQVVNDLLGSELSAYTIELLAEVEQPNSGNDMVIASALKVENVNEITRAAFELTIDETYYLTVRLFPSTCKVANAGESLSPVLSVKSTNAIAANKMSHIRLVVTTTDVYLFINGELDMTQELTGAVCMSPNIAELRIGGIDRSTMFEYGDHRGLRGQVDEFRYSKSARLPLGLQ